MQEQLMSFCDTREEAPETNGVTSAFGTNLITDRENLTTPFLDALLNAPQ